jgi:formylglycine-generating enzyme required for sulfatase activity
MAGRAARAQTMAWLATLLIACSSAAPAPEPLRRVTRAPAARSSPTAMATPLVAALAPAPAPVQADAAPEPDPPEGMLRVPGGTFTMGSNDEGELDERPAHDVTVASFWLDTTEVSNVAYGRCVAAGACRPHDPSNAAHNGFDDRDFRKPNQPVSGVSWDDAARYCEWVGKRLPTEAEFERAARGDDGRRYPWGNEPPDPRRAVFGAPVTADVGTHPAGAGPYGHLDLCGNVWEWVADHYDPFAYVRPTAPSGQPGSCDDILRAQDELRRKKRDGFTGTNPIPTECERVLRGGAFNYYRTGLRASNRVHHPGRFRLVMSGLRCARDVPAAISRAAP